MLTAKTLIRLGGGPGWSESSLGAHAILLVLSWGGSNQYCVMKKSNLLLRRRGTWNLTWQSNSPFQWQIVGIRRCYTVTYSSTFCHPLSFCQEMQTFHNLCWSEKTCFFLPSTQFLLSRHTFVKNRQQCSKLQWVSLRLSQYSTVRFLNFVLKKQETERFVSPVYAMKERDCPRWKGAHFQRHSGKSCFINITLFKSFFLSPVSRIYF